VGHIRRFCCRKRYLRAHCLDFISVLHHVNSKSFFIPVSDFHMRVVICTRSHLQDKIENGTRGADRYPSILANCV